MKAALFVILALASTPSWAILDLHVQESLTVYEKATANSKEISQLVKGDVVVVSPESYGDYRKVLVMYHGKRVAGFVAAKLIKQSYVRDRDEAVEEEDRLVVKRVYTVGLLASGSYLRQGAKSFQATFNSVTNTYDVASLESFTANFGLFADVPLSQSWVVRPYVSFRNTKLKGDATFRNGVNPTTTPTAELDQNMMGFGLVLKYYPSLETGFWLGAAAEYAHPTSTEFNVQDGSPTFAIISEPKRDWIVTQLATGFDVEMGQFQLSPEFRIGGVVNGSPFILSAELLLGFGLRL